VNSVNLISTTLIHKLRPPVKTGPEKPPVLVLLHGRGTNEDDLLGLVDYLDPRFFIISARAPYRFQDGYGGYTWYDVQDIGSPVLQQFDESYRKLLQFLTDIKTGYPVDAESVFLLGFSMGSVMSFAAALTVPGLVRGIVAHSGYVPENTNLSFACNRLQGLSAFVAHGIHDPVIPIEYGRRAHELLKQTSADVTYKEYPIPHTISEQSLSDLSDWLQKKLAVPADMK
jgi:phospholipase/carboxylesterase